MKYSDHLPALQLSIRAALAVGIAIGIARLFRFQYPIYALISAVIVTDLSPAQTRKHGLPRMMGTMVGAMLGGVLGSILQSDPFTIGLSVLAAMFLTHLLRLQDAAKLAGYVCGIVLLNHGDHPWAYALYRFCDTVLGIGVAVGVSYVPQLIAKGKPRPKSE